MSARCTGIRRPTTASSSPSAAIRWSASPSSTATKSPGQAGFFKRDNQRRIDDSYAVTSFHRQPVDILVLEPTPVSQSDKVEVKATLDPEPTVKEWEQRRGLVGWEKTLKPNETARFNVGYTIDYPKEGTVSGTAMIDPIACWRFIGSASWTGRQCHRRCSRAGRRLRRPAAPESDAPRRASASAWWPTV
jgi:hypothetical protein